MEGGRSLVSLILPVLPEQTGPILHPCIIYVVVRSCALSADVILISAGPALSDHWKGCVSDLTIGGHLVSFYTAPSGVSVTNYASDGCHGDPVCQPADTCPANSYCIDEWNQHACVCEEGQYSFLSSLVNSNFSSFFLLSYRLFILLSYCLFILPSLLPSLHSSLLPLLHSSFYPTASSAFSSSFLLTSLHSSWSSAFSSSLLPSLHSSFSLPSLHCSFSLPSHPFFSPTFFSRPFSLPPISIAPSFSSSIPSSLPPAHPHFLPPFILYQFPTSYFTRVSSIYPSIPAYIALFLPYSLSCCNVSLLTSRLYIGIDEFFRLGWTSLRQKCRRLS